MLSSIDSHQKCQKHEEHCNAQLSMELAGISFADFSGKKEEKYLFQVNEERLSFTKLLFLLSKMLWKQWNIMFYIYSLKAQHSDDSDQQSCHGENTACNTKGPQSYILLRLLLTTINVLMRVRR